MNQTKMAQKQMALAVTAQRDREHRFTNLYSFLHWDYWIRCAVAAVLARPASSMAGIDGRTRNDFKAHDEEHISLLVERLKRKTYQPQPLRQTPIPTSNGQTQPPGNSALQDRIVQQALRAILDPIYETDFQPYSFGFRKGRCTMDAIAVILSLFKASNTYYYIIKGDLTSHLTSMHHRKLMSILRRRIADRDMLDLIWKFLKAGVMVDGLFAATDARAAAGEGLAPLLANVYLNEFDKWGSEQWSQSPDEPRTRRKAGAGSYVMLRYADQFIVASNAGIAEVHTAKGEIRDFLRTELHLELSEESSVITHVNAGFDFLGFHLQRCRPNGRWVVHLRPTNKAKECVKQKIKNLTSRNWTWLAEQACLNRLNAIVRGWAEYYRYTSHIRDIEEVARYAWHRYLNWLLRKHKGSRKRQLIRDKARVIHGRTRWVATVHKQGRTVEAYQWLPTREEFQRRQYPQQNRLKLRHPYLPAGVLPAESCPAQTAEPDERLCADTIRASSGRSAQSGTPGTTASQRRGRARDGLRHARCGDRLDPQHRRGARSQRRRT